MDNLFLIYFIGIIGIVIAFLVKGTILTGICLLISLGMFIWANIKKRNELARVDAQRRQISEDALAQIPHTQQFLSPDYLRAMLVCDNTKKFYMLIREDDETQFEVKEYRFNQLFEAAIEEDGSILSFYPNGGLINSTMRKQKSNNVVYNTEQTDEEEEEEETVEKLSLKIVVDDLAEPIIEFVFLESEDEITKDMEEYEEAYKQCYKWYQKIIVIIKRLERKPDGQ